MDEIAVTGGAGFLGSHVVKHLVVNGFRPIVVDNFSTGRRENLGELLEGVRLVAGDLRDYRFASKVLKGVDKLYHFAADIGSVAYLHSNAHSELSALQNNIAIDGNVLRACAELEIRAVIYASSVSVYPHNNASAMQNFIEDMVWSGLAPEGGYGWAKLVAEVQLGMLERTRVGIARIFHAYGPNILLEGDRSQVIGSLVRKAVRYPAEDFTIWGDGTQRRCFLFVDDFIDAIFKLDSYIEDKGSLTVNIGTTEEVTIRELAELVIKTSGKDIHVKYDLSRPVGVPRRIPNLERASRLLNWIPRTKLETGINETYRWAANYLNQSGRLETSL